MVKVTDIKIEKPVLNLKTSSKEKLPDAIPDVFHDGDSPVDKVINESDEFKIDPLIREVDVFLTIGDIDKAKKHYQKVFAIYNQLSQEMKEKHFDAVDNLYKKIKAHGTLVHRVKQFFKH